MLGYGAACGAQFWALTSEMRLLGTWGVGAVMVVIVTLAHRG